MDTWKDEFYQYVKEMHTTDYPEYVKNAMLNNWLGAGWELLDEPEIIPSINPERGMYTVVVNCRRSLDYNKDQSGFSRR